MSRGSYLARTAGGTRKDPTQSGGDRSGFRTLDRPTTEVAQQRQQLQQSIDDRRRAMESMASAGIRSLSGATTDDRAGRQARGQQRVAGRQYAEDTGGTAFTDMRDAAFVANAIEENRKKQEEQKIFGIDTALRNAFNRAQGLTLPGLAGAFQNLTKELRPTEDSFKNKNFLATLENEFRKGNFNRDEYYDTYKDLIDEVFDVGLGGMSAEEMFNTQTVGAFNEAVAGDLGSDIQQRVDPIGFGRELLDKGGPQTSGQAEEFAKIDLSQLTNSPEDRRLAAAVMEARALAADKQSRQDANMGQGIMAASPALPGLPVTGPATVITPTTPELTYEQLLQQYGRPNLIPPELLASVNRPVQPVATGITPFDVRQFYATLPQYTQQGIMNPNLAQFYQNLGMFPGMNV